MVAIMIIKRLLIKYPKFEDNAAFMLTASLIIILTECSIFLSPHQFVISPVTISFAGFQEYYNMSMFTPANRKYIQNRISWAYYVIRNTIAYGAFPIDHIIHIMVLLWF